MISKKSGKAQKKSALKDQEKRKELIDFIMKHDSFYTAECLSNYSETELVILKTAMELSVYKEEEILLKKTPAKRGFVICANNNSYSDKPLLEQFQ